MYLYLDGSLIGQYSNSTTYFTHSDHIGSTRLMTTLTGSTYDNMDYQPFGEQIAGSSGTTHKFEGKERDAETNNDDFGARYYSSSVGRWLSADWSAIPAPVPYANLTNPQTLNLYAMVSDNPESFADLDGHAAINSSAPITPSDDPICANVDSPKGACNAEGAGEFIRAVTTDANNGQDDPVYQEYLDMVADGQKNQASQLVLVPSPGQEYKSSPDQDVQSVTYSLERMDSQGNISTLKPGDEDHRISLGETFAKDSQNKDAHICSPCTSSEVNSLIDTMTATRGKPNTVEKRFTMDNGGPYECTIRKQRKRTIMRG